jgi:Cas6 Crispr
MMNYLEIQYKLVGKTLPADHGYALYSATKKLVLDRQDSYSELLIDCRRQVFNQRSLPPEILISSISGVSDQDGTIYLDRHSRFRLRCPSDRVQLWYRLLQEQVLDIQGHLIWEHPTFYSIERDKFYVLVQGWSNLSPKGSSIANEHIVASIKNRSTSFLSTHRQSRQRSKRVESRLPRSIAHLLARVENRPGEWIISTMVVSASPKKG